MKSLKQSLMKEKNIENWKQALKWWIVKEVMLRKLTWLKKAKKIGINEVIKRDELLITVWNNTFKLVSIKRKSYNSNCRKSTENINPSVSKTSNGKTMLLSKCSTYDSKKSRFIKNQEAKKLLSNVDVRTPLIKVPILGYILF